MVKTYKISEMIQPHLTNIKTYEPVQTSEKLAESIGIPENQVIKLDANENPYGASPKVVDALANLSTHMYPDPFQHRIRNSLAQYIGLGKEYIVAGSGSDEIIDLLIRLFVSSSNSIINCHPTFGMYDFSSKVAGAKVNLAPRNDSFEIDNRVVRNAIDKNTKIIFVSSPNNPTGNTTTKEQIVKLLETGLIVVVDEAYYEFCGETAAGLVENNENLVVLRTMSKWAGLAGLRVGYGIMNPIVVKHIMDIKQPYNVSTAAEVALIASINDSDWLLDKINMIIGERNRMFSLLDRISGVKPWPSKGNFILCQFENNSAEKIYRQLAQKGIFVRFFSSNRLKNFLRVSVSIPEHTDALIENIKTIV